MSIRRASGWALPGNRWDLLDGMTPASPASVSVIVAHYDQHAQLARTLHAIGRQDYPPELVEVIVVDDGSLDAPQVPGDVRLLRQDDDGFRLAAARNRGAATARHDVLVFLDADTAPEPGYLRHITRLPTLGWDCVSVGRRRHADFSNLVATDDVETAGPANELAEPTWLLDAYRASGNLLRADHRSYRFVIGAVIACSRRFFAETGGFDETFTHYGGEDWEWAYRAWLNGAVLAHVPDAVAWHDGPSRPDRVGADVTFKNIETLKLVDLIPVPGSRGRAIASARVDIAVTGPSASASAGQRFVSIDSVLAEIDGAVAMLPGDQGVERFDRVRMEVRLERPIRVVAGALVQAVEAIESERYGEVVLLDTAGEPLVRIVSRRAECRQQRWGGEPLLPTLELIARGVEPLTVEVDLEAYLGGW